MLASPHLILEENQDRRFKELLARSLAEVPLYQRQRTPILNGEQDLITAPVCLRHFPFVTKEDIRRNFPRNFLGDTADLQELIDSGAVELEHTSGTSEDRTALILPTGWWAAQEQAALRVNSLVAEVLQSEANPRRVTINSPVCNGEISFTRVPSRMERTVGNTLFLSVSRYPFLWDEAELARMAAEAIARQPRFLDVDPVYGTVFALYCERNGIALPCLRFILSSYEFISVIHRRVLERVFKVPVFDLYGSTETGHLVMEDERHQMRASPETAAIEMIEVDANGVGELVVTSLSNQLMPLIRYRIGDLAQRIKEPWGTRYVLHGRVADAICQPPGQRVTTRQVDQCFSSVDGLASYQLIEQPGNEWRLRIVPESGGPSAKTLALLHERLTRLLLPGSKITTERTDLLMPEKSGKFRLVYPLAKSGPPSGPSPGIFAACRLAPGG